MVITRTGIGNGYFTGGDPTDQAVGIGSGLPSQALLRVASSVIAEETVTIGGEVFRVAVVNTDSTKVTANGDLNNTYDESIVTMAAHGLKGGDLIRVQNEIMRVLQVLNASRFRVKRGVSGTTIATHADGQSIYTEATPGAGSLAVGLVTTLTPAAFITAIAADINAGLCKGYYKATGLTNALHVATADAPGGNPVPSSYAGAVSETLTGSNNAWDGSTFAGRPVQQYMRLKIIPTAAEVALGFIRRLFPWVPIVENCSVKTTSTQANVAWDGAITITGNMVIIDNTGSVDWATTSEIDLTVRGA